MKNTKIVKAKCKKTGKAFGLEIKKKGSRWEVVDFVPLTPEQDAKLESQEYVTNLQVAASIQACGGCGSRKVGGCSCATEQRHRCSSADPYRYQCIFCNHLELDFSEAREARDGEQIKLSQGQVITLSKRGVSISKLMVGMGWQPSRTSHSMDLDSSVVMLNQSGTINSLIYFGHLRDRDNSVIHHGDNLTGSVKYNGVSDDENISIDLSLVPKGVTCLVFIVNIYKAYKRRQALQDVRDIHIRLIEDRSKQVLAQYNTFSQSNNATGMIIGAAYREGGKWSFRAMGDCYRVETCHDLAEIAKTQCEKYTNL